MIYKFKSQADADIIMLAPNGDQMLQAVPFIDLLKTSVQAGKDVVWGV